jgi:hypothetical protein
VHEGQPIGSLERPDLVRLEKDKAPLAPRDDPSRTAPSSAGRRAPLMQTAQALGDPLLAERLEQVIDDAELERLERVLLSRLR